MRMDVEGTFRSSPSTLTQRVRRLASMIRKGDEIASMIDESSISWGTSLMMPDLHILYSGMKAVCPKVVCR